jgi:hypothetical protein
MPGRALVTKCAALLRQDIALSLVDLVTVRRFNLYADLLAWIGQHDPSLGEDPPPSYAASLRFQTGARRSRLQSWPSPLIVGRPLPTLPLWLSTDRSVPLSLLVSDDTSSPPAAETFLDSLRRGPLLSRVGRSRSQTGVVWYDGFSCHWLTDAVTGRTRCTKGKSRG